MQYHKDGEIDDYSYWMIETDGRLIVIWDLFSQPDDSGSLFLRKLEPSFSACPPLKYTSNLGGDKSCEMELGDFVYAYIVLGIFIVGSAYVRSVVRL